MTDTAWSHGRRHGCGHAPANQAGKYGPVQFSEYTILNSYGPAYRVMSRQVESGHGNHTRLPGRKTLLRDVAYKQGRRGCSALFRTGPITAGCRSCCLFERSDPSSTGFPQGDSRFRRRNGGLPDRPRCRGTGSSSRACRCSRPRPLPYSCIRAGPSSGMARPTLPISGTRAGYQRVQGAPSPVRRPSLSDVSLLRPFCLLVNRDFQVPRRVVHDQDKTVGRVGAGV